LHNLVAAQYCIYEEPLSCPASSAETFAPQLRIEIKERAIAKFEQNIRNLPAGSPERAAEIPEWKG
jgi:hypothetical protein